MAGKVLSSVSIANGITVLILDAIWLIDHLIFKDNMTTDLEIIAMAVFVFCFFVSFILGLIGVIFSLIIIPFCIKENKARWLIGFILNLAAFLIPGVPGGIILFFIFGFVNPFTR